MLQRGKRNMIRAVLSAILTSVMSLERLSGV